MLSNLYAVCGFWVCVSVRAIARIVNLPNPAGMLLVEKTPWGNFS